MARGHSATQSAFPIRSSVLIAASALDADMRQLDFKPQLQIDQHMLLRMYKLPKGGRQRFNESTTLIVGAIMFVSGVNQAEQLSQ